MMTVDEHKREIAALSQKDRRRLLGEVFLVGQNSDYLETLAKRLDEPRPGPNWVPLAELERRLRKP